MTIYGQTGNGDVAAGQMDGCRDGNRGVDERIQGEGQVNHRSKGIIMDNEANVKSRV